MKKISHELSNKMYNFSATILTKHTFVSKKCTTVCFLKEILHGFKRVIIIEERQVALPTILLPHVLLLLQSEQREVPN